MRRFKFSLAPILSLKVAKEDAALRKFGEAVAFRAQTAELLKQANFCRQSHLDSIQHARALRLEAVHQQSWFDELNRLEAECSVCADGFAKAMGEERKAKNAYLKAHNESKALHNLKDKRVLQHNKTQEKANEKELEEIMLSRRNAL
jgi:flagellar biosynthesis chaperone FliJ